MTTIGFFSAVLNVREPETETLLVRARTKRDLVRLKKELAKLRDPECDQRERVISTPGADYPHRIVVHASRWAAFLSAEALKIDYPNFKNAVGKKAGKKHADAFHRVWDVLHDLEEKSDRKPRAATLARMVAADGPAPLLPLSAADWDAYSRRG